MTEIDDLRARLAHRVGRDLAFIGCFPLALLAWQATRLGPATAVLVPIGATPVVCGAVAAILTRRAPSLGAGRRKTAVALVLGGLCELPVLCAATIGLVPGLAAGTAAAWLLAAFLVGPRTALGIGFALVTWLLAAGALHQGRPGLTDNSAELVSVTAWQNWVRTLGTTAALVAATIPPIVAHLRALADATRRSRELLAAAAEQEQKRIEANAARSQADAARRDAQAIEVLDLVAPGLMQRCKNVLQAIGTELDMLHAHPSDASGVPQGLTDMMEAVRAAAAVLRRLHTLREDRDRAPLAVVDLREFARSARRQLANVHGLEVVVEAQPAPPALADDAELHSVLLNLALNARDAMPDGGMLTLRSRAATPEEQGQTGCGVALDVVDTGAGMDAATLARVFEPFFTTKGAAGTGMGLHAARRVLASLGGSMRVKSEVGKGTTFTLFLRAAPLATPVPLPRVTPRAGAGVPVLVADDDPAVRRSWTAALERYGYVVLEAEDIAGAIRVARERPVALAWLDAAMPGGRVETVIDKLHEAQPHAHVVVCSGLLERDIEAVCRRGVEFVAKPCFLSALLERAERAANGYRRA